MRRHGSAAVGALALALAAACGSPTATPEDAARVRRGRDVYVFEGCGNCHGADRRGSRTAPTLEGVQRHWSAEELLRYLRAPRAYPADRRLRSLSARFRAEMAGLPAADQERVRDLVAFLLSP
jgi:cytochrome c2